MSGAGTATAQTGDADLRTHLRAGRSSAHAALMRRPNQRLYRLARGILRDDAAAEEAVQEGYVRAFRTSKTRESPMRSALAAFGIPMLASLPAAAEVTTAPPGGAYKKVSELVELPDFLPSLGTLYVGPKTLPAGPFLAHDHAGSAGDAGADKIKQADAHYRHRPNGQQRCEICLQFAPPNRCRIVRGPILPHGWCQFFAARDNAH
ncbi:MAG TPA: sigma factor [Stellaceae bacterium]|nr:sigma factor [Stellaceae bacterium]